jgi:hypothetical protein
MEGIIFQEVLGRPNCLPTFDTTRALQEKKVRGYTETLTPRPTGRLSSKTGYTDRRTDREQYDLISLLYSVQNKEKGKK